MNANLTIVKIYTVPVSRRLAVSNSGSESCRKRLVCQLWTP